MRLPSMRKADGIGKSVQVQFGGYDHRLSAQDGALWDMRNLTGDQHPLLAVRGRRRKAGQLARPGGLGNLNGLYWADGTGFYYKGVRKRTVTAGRKLFAGMGSRIVIFPDKAVYDTAQDSFRSLEASFTTAAGGAKFGNGTLYEEAAERNTLTVGGADFRTLFSPGDAVTVSGCTRHPANNKTPIIREISPDGQSLRFYENVFETEGTEEDPQDYTEPGAVTIARTVPDLDWICVNDNRLWGCKGDTIYGSKLGDPMNFNVFDGLAGDSYSVESGSAGDFTGCCSYLGYPCFFKEDRIFKIYGSKPSNYELMGSATLGVASGCGGTLAVAGEVLFYVSPSGPAAYSGGIPSNIAEAFGGERFTQGAAGSDGRKYYLSARSGQGWRLFVYDSLRGLWHREDETEAIGFAMEDGGLHILNAAGELWRADGGGEGELEPPLEWLAEFGDFTEGSPDAKGYGKLQLRLELEAGAEISAFLRYDSRGDWEPVRTLAADGKRSYLLPIVPRRADHCRLRLTGQGGCVVYSLARQYYGGSEHRTF